MVVGLVSDVLRNPCRRTHPFDRRDRAGASHGAVHDRRVELHDAFSVREATPTDAGLLRIELNDRHAGNERIEHVGSVGHHRKRCLDARLSSLALRPVAVR